MKTAFKENQHLNDMKRGDISKCLLFSFKAKPDCEKRIMHSEKRLQLGGKPQ